MAQVYKVFSIRDSKAEAYSMPFYQTTTGLAERMFSQLIKDPQSQVAKNPEDFALFQVGTFDDQTGRIETLDQPVHIANAINLV